MQYTLHIFTLAGFAISQPLYDLLSRNPEFFVARQSEPIDVLFLVLILSFLIPTSLVIATWLSGLFGRRLGKGAYVFFVIGLFSLTALPAIKKMEFLPPLITLGLTILLSAVAAISYFRHHSVRSFLTILSPAVLVFPALFIFNSPVYKIVFPKDSFQFSNDRSPVQATTPVVLLVFDALSTPSLMNEKHELDSLRYPNFGGFAKNATWFRNATAVSDYTHMAIPSILSGRYPDKPRLPTLDDYPNNIFTLLGSSYEYVVNDPNSNLCPVSLCNKKTKLISLEEQTLAERVHWLMMDISVAYLHILLPVDLLTELPPVTRTWKNFMGKPKPKIEDGQEQEHSNSSSTYNKSTGSWLQHVTGERPAQFSHFIKSINNSRGPTIHYLHSVIPHMPWRYLPSGKEYIQPSELTGIRGLSGVGDDGETWNSDGWAITQGFQRYLFQLKFTDKLFGEIIKRLKEVALYERALIIVTADHGVSFRPNDKRRPITQTNFHDIMSVPLFIKKPNQQKGEINDRNVELVDILPTIADQLGIPLPWPVDGQSVFNPTPQERTKKYFYKSGKNKIERMVFNANISGKFDTADHMISLFGSGNKTAGLFKIGPHNNIVGKRIHEMNVISGSEFLSALSGGNSYENIDSMAPFIPAQIRGSLESKRKLESSVNLAIAVNGIIHAVTRTYPLRDTVHEWLAIVPETAFQHGKNSIEVFHVVQNATGGLNLITTTNKKIDNYILSKTKSGEVITSPEGKPIAVIPKVLLGYVDYADFYNQLIRFKGWAADVINSALPDRILIFVNGKFVYSGRTNKLRPDVAKHFKNDALQSAGFVYSFPFALFQGIEKPEVRFFALNKEGIASELHYKKNYKWGAEGKK